MKTGKRLSTNWLLHSSHGDVGCQPRCADRVVPHRYQIYRAAGAGGGEHGENGEGTNKSRRGATEQSRNVKRSTGNTITNTAITTHRARWVPDASGRSLFTSQKCLTAALRAWNSYTIILNVNCNGLIRAQKVKGNKRFKFLAQNTSVPGVCCTAQGKPPAPSSQRGVGSGGCGTCHGDHFFRCIHAE